jgi:hypothetical protein
MWLQGVITNAPFSGNLSANLKKANELDSFLEGTETAAGFLGFELRFSNCKNPTAIRNFQLQL